MKRSRGFTLIELLVVVGIIALLIAILLPSLARAKETTRRTVCLANLKAQGSMLAIYASQDRKASLPNFGPANWLHDESTLFGDTLLGLANQSTTNNGDAANGAQNIRVFYCPSSTLAADYVHAWNNPGNAGGGQGDNSAQGLYRAFGYEYLNARGSFAVGSNAPIPTAALQTTSFLRGDPPLAFQNSENVNQASLTEVITDAVISTPNSGGANPTDYSVPTASNNGGDDITESTSHLNGKKPAGSNELFLDSHAEWRKYGFNGTTALAVPVPTGSGVFFWFPNP